MTENSPVCLSDEGSSAARIPTEPLDDPWAELERLARAATPGPWAAYGDEVRLPKGGTMFVSFRGNGKSDDAAFIAAARRDVLKLIEAARRSAGGYEPKANAQSPLSGSQALPSASTTNIRALPDTAGEAEPVAWVQPEALFYITAGVEGSYRLAAGMCSEYTEPLYSEATVQALQKREAGLRSALHRITTERCDPVQVASSAILNQTEER